MGARWIGYREDESRKQIYFLYCLLERDLVFDLQSLTLVTSRLARFFTSLYANTL